MTLFHSGRDAKEFLISRIVAEAQRENVQLSELERKMLYFSESAWTLPDMMAISEAFDGEYDQSKYEEKIARLVRGAAKHDREESRDEYDAWWAAIHFLRGEDHYISVLIGVAGLRPAGDELKLLGTALGIVGCLLLAIFLSVKYKFDLSQHLPSRGVLTFYALEAGIGLVIAYLMFLFVFGKKRTDDMTNKALEKLIRIYRRSRD